MDTSRTKIFVGGLKWATTNEALRQHFEPFGEITEAVVIMDRVTGRSKGYGFVTFVSPESAINATQDGYPVIDGRRTNCNLAVLGAKPRRADQAQMDNPPFMYYDHHPGPYLFSNYPPMSPYPYPGYGYPYPYYAPPASAFSYPAPSHPLTPPHTPPHTPPLTAAVPPSFPPLGDESLSAYHRTTPPNTAPYPQEYLQQLQYQLMNQQHYYHLQTQQHVGLLPHPTPNVVAVQELEAAMDGLSLVQQQPQHNASILENTPEQPALGSEDDRKLSHQNPSRPKGQRGDDETNGN